MMAVLTAKTRNAPPGEVGGAVASRYPATGNPKQKAMASALRKKKQPAPDPSALGSG